MAFATIALVGSVGAVSTGASGAAVTPAWGTSENRTAGNLLVLQVAVTGSATIPGTPSGWTSGVTRAGTTCSCATFYKVAAGTDTAPTVAAITSGIINARLMEFSGTDATSPFVSSGVTSGTTSPLVATNAAADPTSGSLMVSTGTHLKSSAGAITTQTDTYTNGTAIQTSNKATSTVSHYDFCYSLTTANASADSDSLAYTTTTTTGVALALCSFKPATLPPPTDGYLQSVSVVGGTGHSGSGTATAATLPSAVTAGNLLVADVLWRSGTATVSISDGHNTWVAVGSPQYGAGGFAGFGYQQFYTANVAAGTYAITATCTASVQYLDIAVTEVLGRATTSPLDVFSYANATGTTTWSSPSITPTTADSYVHAGTGVTNVVTGPNAPFTQREWANWDQNSVSDYLQTTAAAISATWTGTGNTDEIAGISAYKPKPAITRASGFPTLKNTSSTSASVTWGAVGDLAVVAAQQYIDATTAISGVSSPNTTNWQLAQFGPDSSDAAPIAYTVWIGTITAAGADTLSIAWNATAPTSGNFELLLDEFSSGLGASTSWTLVAHNYLRDATTNNKYPSLTSGAGSLQMYWGEQGSFGTSAVGSTSGFTYTTTGNIFCYNGALAPSTVYQPTSGSSGGAAMGVAFIVSATTGPATGAVAMSATAGLTAALPISVPTLVNSVTGGSTAGNGFITSAVNMTGANLLVVQLDDNSNASTFVDSQSNTYTLVVSSSTGGGTRMFYCLNPSVSSAMTWTITATSQYPGIAVMGFAGVATTAALDQSNVHGYSFVASAQPGSITPSGNGYLVVTGAFLASATVPTVDSGFSTPVYISQANSQHNGAALAYLVQSTAAAINPTWAGTSAGYDGATIASFVPGTGGGGGPATVTGATTLAATAGMTVGASVTQLAAVTLAGGAHLTVTAAVTELTPVSMAATTGLTVTGVRTEFGAITLAATAGMTVSASVTELASVVELASTTGMFVGTVLELASVTMVATAGLSVAAGVTEVAAVSLAASAALTTTAAVTEIAVVAMSATSGLTATGTVTAAGVIVGDTTMHGVTGMTVGASVTQIASVLLAASASLTATPAGAVLGQALLTAVASLIAADNLPATVTGQVAMASAAALTTNADALRTATVAMAAVTSLMAVGVVLAGEYILAATAGMMVTASVTAPAQVHMAVTSHMMVEGTVTHKVTTLADQVTAVLGQDPQMLGATGYVDEVFPSRLSGPTQ